MAEKKAVVRPTPAEVRVLNESYYDEDPSMYLHIRFLTLLSIAGDGERFADHFRGDGVTYGRVRMTDAASDLEDEIPRYVALDSQMLLHHAAEAFLRSFWAHQPGIDCPWWVISQRDFGALKRRCEDLIDSPDRLGLREAVEYALVYRDTPPDGTTPDEFEALHANLAAYVIDLTETWLHDADLYNSGKHGAVAFPGSALLLVEADDGEAIALGQGPSIRYLKPTKPQWAETTQWIDVDRSLCMIKLAIDLLASTWSIGRHRHTRELSETFGVVYAVDQPISMFDFPGSHRGRVLSRWLDLAEEQSS